MKPWVDKWILANWGTKVMAISLSLLLWIYLYEESTDSGTFPATFLPRLENRSEFSHILFLDKDGDPLGETISVKVTGPKGDLRGLSKKGIRCEPMINKDRFSRDMGNFTRDLQLDDLNLPETLTVDFGSLFRIRVEYVRFKIADFDLPNPSVMGTPISGFEVEGVTIRPSPVPLRFPADHRPEVIRIKPVSVEKRASSFTIEAELDRDGLDPEVSLEVRPIVEVTLVPQKANFHADVPLHLSGPPAITSRLELLTTMIKVTVVGPENVIQAIQDDASNLLYAFVVVQIPEAQLELEKQFPLTQIHCVVRESRYAGEVQIIPMSDIQDPDNREVIVKVMK